MKPVSYLQGIRKYFLNGGGIGAGTVTCYCLDLFIVGQPFFKGRTVSPVKYCSRRVSRFIYDNGSVSMSFFKGKIINSDNASAFRCFLESIPFCEQAYHGIATDFKIHSLTDT